MILKVAVVGPATLVQRIMETGQQYPGLDLLPVVYRSEADALELTLHYQSQVDAFLFAGRIPYDVASRQIRDIPMVYIHHTGSGLYRVLFQILRESAEKLSPLPLRLSVDVLQPEEVRAGLEEIGLRAERLFIREYLVGQSAEEMVQFHYNLWKTNQIDHALTCVTSVYNRLKELGVKSYRILPTRPVIADALKMVQLERKKREIGSTQLAVYMVSLRESIDGDVAAISHQGIGTLDLRKMMANFGERTQTLMYWSDRNKMTFITTRGVIEELTRNFTISPLLAGIKLAPGWTLSQGIGIGWTANDAEVNAKEALAKAERQVGGGCYAVLEERTILGPLGKTTQLVYSSRSRDPQRLALARQAGVSIGTINKLMALRGQFAQTALSAAELANWFGITLRSSRRLLSQLIQSNLAAVVGEEQPINKGRPRQLYSLRFPEEAKGDSGPCSMC
ncbi:MAG: transcriptional regulator [Veillonellaceae bacterium]|nr:transcriptional regulator [Veillonellaceae bacterium]